MKKTLLSLSGALAPSDAKPAPTVGGSVPAESAAVDLGLTSGTLWAPWNVGATKPGEAGAYFAWGETTAKESYDWSNYKHMKEGESDWRHINKYTTEDNLAADWYTRTFIGDSITTLEESDDAAAVNWGGDWRMPTQAQLKELFDYCTREWMDEDWDANGSLAGYLLTGPNGKKLFLPAAGKRGSDLCNVGSCGCFWSAELDSSNSNYARYLEFYSGYWHADYFDRRYYGFSVRPVCHSAETTKAYNTPDVSVGGQVPTVAEAVDLGLPSGTLWAPWNVGATKPGEAGAYFAWGETATKESYDLDTYKHMKEGKRDLTNMNKYTVDDGQMDADWYTDVKFVGDGKTTLEVADDAAAQNWGGKWRMPTQDQLNELFSECTYEWKDEDWDANGSLAGYLLTGPNGKKLFLPAADRRWGSVLRSVGSDGYYWSAELDSGDSICTSYLYFNSDDGDVVYNSRCNGYSVRPVCPSAETTNAYNTPDVSVGGQVPTVAAAVDLGLTSGTLWAPWNVGATKPGEAGAYFAWGETTAKESYDWSTYKHMKEGESDWSHINKYTTEDNQGGDWYTRTFIGDGKITLDESDDAAAVNWGGGWRMPTQAQLQELSDYCTWEWKDADWDSNGSLAGYLLTSNANGKKLFLPAAGGRWGFVLNLVGSCGYYWSADLCSGESDRACNLGFSSGGWYADDCSRFSGFSVRPVCPSAEATKSYNTPDGNVGGQVPEAAEAVDLGLPSGTLWAPYNVGATKPGEAGAYFAWGETTAKESYDMGSYKWMIEGESDWTHMTKYAADDDQITADWYTDVKFVGDGKTTLEAADDAAARNWGGKWRMPTLAQLNELFTECITEWKEADWDANGSLAGYLLTGPNGKRLFLPAAGGRWGSDLDDVGSRGYYWGSDLVSVGSRNFNWSAVLSSGYTGNARHLIFFNSGCWCKSRNSRCDGFSVRPVCPSAE